MDAVKKSPTSILNYRPMLYSNFALSSLQKKRGGGRGGGNLLSWVDEGGALVFHFCRKEGQKVLEEVLTGVAPVLL